MAATQWKVSLPSATREEVKRLVARDRATYETETDFVKQAVKSEIRRARNNPPGT